MNPHIYLDNAATTALSPEVLESMMPFLTESYGNPSSVYSIGRNSRLAVETARRTVAACLSVKPSTIFFTGSGTEANNMAVLSAVRDMGCTAIISSPTEHHAVLHTVEYYSRQLDLPLDQVAVSDEGIVDYEDLERLLLQHQQKGMKSLVSLMYANNEIGSILDIQRVGQLCQQYDAIFHSDCVQAIGHYPIKLSEIPVHYVSASGHKFHGPKGTGILYVAPSAKIKPLIHGGSQERNVRAGTENVYGIVGFAKALEIATLNYEKDSAHIRALNTYMRKALKDQLPDIRFNGPEDGLYTVLSVCFPDTPAAEGLLLKLDQAGICASGGSACTSGQGSHVLQALGNRSDCNTVRFSFSKHNSKEDIDRTIDALTSILQPENATATI